MRNIISKILFTLLVLTMGIGSVWGTTYSSTPLISGDFSGMSDGTPTAISGFTYNGASISSGKLTWTGNWSEGSRDVQVTFTITGTACKLVLGHATSSSSMSIKGILYKGTTSVSNFASSAWSIDKTKTADEKEFTSLTAGTYTLKLGPGGTSSRSVITSITIYDEAAANPSAAPSITAQPATAAANYEKDATATALSVTAIGNGTLTYQWYKNTANNNTSGTPISGATSASYTPSTTEVGTLYYYCVVTNTESGKSGTTAKSNVSGAITVQMNPLGDGHVLTWNLGTAAQDYTAIETTSKSSTSSLITSLSDLGMTGVNINSGKKQGKSGNTPGINFNTATEDDGKYVSLSYTITDGYEFQVTAISLKVLTITSDYGNYHAVLEDENGTKIEGSLENPSNGSLTSITFSSYKTLKGDCSLKLYGWDEKTGDANAPYSYRLGGAITITGTVAEAGAAPSGYTVTYAGDKDGGSFPVDADVYASGAEVTVKDKPEGLTRTILGAPATFLGWSTNENMYGGTHYKAGDKFTITANTTLYAIWGFNITYIDEDKSTEITGLEPTYYIYGEGATLPTNPTAPTGYTFGGWYNAWCVDESSTSSSPCGENAPCGFDDTHCLTTEIGTTDTWDAEYYAKWILSAPTYEVTFNMNDHGTAPTKQDVIEGGTATAPFVADVDGWVFGGWYTDAECTAGNEFSFSTAITANRPLYAKWTADACSLDRQSLSKVVLTSATEGTVTGYNSNEYAGIAVIASLKDDGKTADIIGDATEEHGYKLNSSGKSIVFATLKKGDFQEGDKVIVGVIKKNDQRTVDESTDILTIYAGSDKDHVLEVATIKNVNAPGFYTYRLTAANATAINTAGYKSIGVFRASANGENHNIYSVEITGCRSWTITHNVTFDMKGHGTQVDPQVVAEGDPVTKPSDPVAANWAFCGWYKETTLENEWNFTTDVMGTGDFTLYAKWEDETGAIKLFDGEGNLNTTHFVSAPKNADPIEIASVEYPCLTQFAANRTSLGGAVPADFVQYNATTDAAKIKITLYNTNSGEKSALLYMVEEGDTEFTPVEIKVPGQTIFTTSYYTFNSTKNRSFYLCAKDRSNIRVLQVTVMDNGNAIHMAGQAGYSMNFNKGRMYVPTSAATSFEGATINVSSEYKVANNSSLATNSYISFTTTVDKTVLRVTRAGGNYYVSQDPDNKGTSYSTNQEIELSPAGTWYIGSINPGSAASFSKIEFIAPKCEEPAFNALANSDLCEGDGFAALDGTGTVSDGGTITYKWYAHGADESDPTAVLATTATYTPTADGIYYVKALHHVDGLTDNEVTSSEVTVTHFASAVITAAPANVRKSAGEAAALTVEATGKNLSYAWYTCDDALGTNPVAIVPAETNATLNVMVPDGIQYYMVIVSSDCGADLSAVAKVEKFVALPQLHINATTTWDLTTCADAEIVLTSSTSPKKGEECLMANIEGVHLDANFNSQALVISGEYIYRNISGKPTCAEYMKFITDVEGVVTVTFAGNGSNRLIRVTGANGVQYSTVSAGTGDTHTEKFYVTPGEVELMGMNAAMTQDKRYMRFFNITFTAEPDYIRPTTEGRYGTICLPNGGVMVGADLFEVAYYGATSQKIFFDQIMNGEMEAGIPYIFLPKEGVSQLGVYYTDAAGSTAGNRNGLYGSYTTEVLTRNDGNYVLYNNQYLYVGDESTNVKVGANRAYIKLAEITPIEPALAPGRRRVSMGVIGAPQVTTGVGELNADETPIKVMIDGQLYIIRGEKMYDATGRLVK